ncbi:MAG: hypothetical protein ABI856_13430, partial [Nitrospira sp.]
PDADLFRLALDIAQVPARLSVYIDNTPMFVQIAEGLGMRSILHTDYKPTRFRNSMPYHHVNSQITMISKSCCFA